MKAVSLFSGAGIGESRLGELDIDVLVANELVEDRADIYRQLIPSSKMISGNVLDENIFNQLIENTPSDLDLLIATPPCQGVSIAGKNRSSAQQIADERNYLLLPVIRYIHKVRPKFVLIENVPQYLDLRLNHKGSFRSVIQILNDEFHSDYTIEGQIINCADLGVPQSRKRSFIKLYKKGYDWPWPELSSNHVVLSDILFDLPSLEAGEASRLRWHFARKHSDSHVLWMSHTPTGCTAFDNPIFFPKKDNGEVIKAYSTTYRRLRWDRPSSAITMRNDAISSQMNVHPGRKKRNGTYSDARVLTPLELLKVNSMDTEQWNRIEASESVVRKVLGEGVPPLAINQILSTLVGRLCH
jgi:DNA (cytosine-5)-methyltransferase 1